MADIRNINKINSKGDTLLILAVKQGKIQEVKRLLTANANINKPDKNGLLAINFAIDKGQMDIVKLLLSAGANIHKRTKQRASIIDYASGAGNIELVRLLIATGQYEDYRTAILAASRSKHFAIVKLLLTAHGNYSLSSIVSTAASRNDVTLLKLLLARKAFVSVIEGSDKNTALFYASEEGHTEIVRLLLLAGAEVDIANYFGEEPGGGRTSLYIASEKGYVAIVKLLLAANANINMSIDAGISPLENTVMNKGSSKVIDLLLKAQLKQGFIANGLSELINTAASVNNTTLVKGLKRYQKRCKKC